MGLADRLSRLPSTREKLFSWWEANFGREATEEKPLLKTTTLKVLLKRVKTQLKRQYCHLMLIKYHKVSHRLHQKQITPVHQEKQKKQ